MADLFPIADDPVSLADMIHEAERELHMRESVYPRRVAAGKMSATQAARATSIQRHIIAHLRAIGHLGPRLNDYLVDMKADHDDGVTGFNEAWDIMRKVFAEAVPR